MLLCVQMSVRVFMVVGLHLYVLLVGPRDVSKTTHSVTIYAKSVSTILDAWAQIAYQQILASLRMERAGQCS